MNPSHIQPETPQQVFVRQTRRFRELFDAQMRSPLPGPLALPKTVLAFAEDLILCPTEEAVTIRIERDRQAARGCYVTANDVVSEIGRGNAQIAIPVGPSETPFCLLASVVIARVREAVAKHGDSWGSPPFHLFQR
jgi:hypothetical protein